MPTFRTSQTRTGTRAIPTEAPLPRPTDIPASAADVGAGAVGRGLTALGQGVSDVGSALFAIEQEKQKIRDNASLARANNARDEYISDKADEARRTDFTSIEQFTEFRKQLESGLDASVQDSISKMSSRAGQDFDNFAENNRESALRFVERDLWPKEIQFGQSDTLRQYTTTFEMLAKAGVPVEDILKDPSLKIIETGMKPYWKTGEMAKARERTLIDALVNVGRYDDARKLAQTTKAFTPTEKQARLRNIDTAERAKQNKAQIAQESYINETHKLTMDTLVQDIDDLTILNKLPADLKSYWENKLADRDKMIKADKGDPFVNVYDPARYNSFRTIMEQDPKNLKESQIVDSVGYGLTLDQGVDLVERHRKLSRKDSPLTASNAVRAVERITNAFEAGIIKHPDFTEGAAEGSEDEYRNSLLRDQMIDELEQWLQEKPRSPEEVLKRTTETLKPYEEMEARGFMNQVFHNIFSREAWVFSARDYREAISSLNKDAQAEWEHVGIGERRNKFRGVLPEDFIRKWQSPNKILTPQIARIYKKWAHGDLEKAKAMAAKDNWKEPK